MQNPRLWLGGGVAGIVSTCCSVVSLPACSRGREPETAAPPASAAVATRPDTAPLGAPPTLAGSRLQLEDGVFALTNLTGAQLIALDSVSQPTRIRAAVCGGGRIFPVSYLRRQVGRPDSASRQTAAAFAYLTGDLYQVTAGSTEADATCYLSSDSSLLAAVMPVASAQSDACGASLQRGMEASRERPVVKCWVLGRIGLDLTVAAAQFATRDTSALASIVVTDHGRLLFEDFPATYRGPDQDVWRADDAGEFSPDGFRVLFLARVRGTDVMAFTWAGSEGEGAYLVVADSGAAFRTIGKSYRYWVAE